VFFLGAILGIAVAVCVFFLWQTITIRRFSRDFDEAVNKLSETIIAAYERM